MQKPSNIFTGFRALGFISNHVPLCIRYHQRHKENYAITVVGKSFHVYSCSKLAIKSVADAHDEPIGCVAVDGIFIYTASGKTVKAFSRGRKSKHTYTGHESAVHLLMPFADHLISIDNSSCVLVHNILNEELFLELQFDTSSFDITAAVHPNTYVNKVLFGSRQGELQLWNLRTNKQVFRFDGWGQPITALEQAPAVDVIAIGLADGRIILHNLRYDETVMTFTQDWGPVTAISFRTDGHPIMATGSVLGHIALWDLEERRLQSQMRDAHAGAVTGLKCLPSEPLMITSSPDNSLKMWIFDLSDGGGRLLRQRTGHSAPPTRVRYYDDQGKTLVTAGQDSTMHMFSTVHERLNHNLGRASYNKKETKKSGLKNDQHMMPPITTFAAEPSRQSDWDSIVACHRGEKVVTTWNTTRYTMGAYKLSHSRYNEKAWRNATAQCVDVSSCGNFAVIGYSTGHVDHYNIQSGLHRGSYGKDRAHKGSVRGVVMDGLNQVMVSAGADQCIKFWKFKSKALLGSLRIDGQVAQLLLHRESSMLAVSLDEFEIIIIDMDTRKIVRKFPGHNDKIMDMAFSADSRWLLSASMDATVKTWDLPTGRLVDCFMVDSAVTSLALSPTSDFLTTTHVDDLGVYLWSNMTLYMHVNLKPLPLEYEPVVIDMPLTSTKSTSSGVADELEEALTDDGPLVEFKTPEQIADELVTLSLLPNSRWLNLINLDVIKQRNKPKQPPKVPKAAPFFLPTISGLTPQFVVEKEETDGSEISHVFKSQLLSLSAFGKVLRQAAEKKDYQSVLAALKDMGPSSIDVELRSMSPEGGGSVDVMADFLSFINIALKTNRDFELIQAYLGLFLKLHGDLISKEPSLVEILEQIQETQQTTWHSIQTLFNQSSCIVNYLKSAAL